MKHLKTNFKETLQKELKTAKETSQMLGVTPQRLSAIKEKGLLEPVLSTTQGDLYSLTEINEYMYGKKHISFANNHNHTVHAIIDLLLQNYKIVLTGKYGKTTLIELINEKFTDYVQDKCFHLYDYQMNFDVSLLNSEKGVLVTAQGNDSYEGIKDLIDRTKISPNEILEKIDTIVETQKTGRYKITYVTESFKEQIT